MTSYFYDQSPHIVWLTRKNTAVLDGKLGIFECRFGILRSVTCYLDIAVTKYSLKKPCMIYLRKKKQASVVIRSIYIYIYLT